jgi:alkylhydroperoxidase/carboxymuconolactone decarboxylase family protein YurZ
MTRQELRHQGEAIIQTAPYTGFPPALNALAAISAAFAT